MQNRREFLKLAAAATLTTTPIFAKEQSQSGGLTGLTMDEILAPFKATAAHAGMSYLAPLYFLGVSASRIERYQAELIARLVP